MFPASASTVEFSTHIQEVHTEVRKALTDAYLAVKAKVNQHRREQTFKVGNWILAYVQHHLQSKNLQVRRCCPFEVIKICGDNSYQLALPP